MAEQIFMRKQDRRFSARGSFIITPDQKDIEQKQNIIHNYYLNNNLPTELQSQASQNNQQRRQSIISNNTLGEPSLFNKPRSRSIRRKSILLPQQNQLNITGYQQDKKDNKDYIGALEELRQLVQIKEQQPNCCSYLNLFYIRPFIKKINQMTIKNQMITTQDIPNWFGDQDIRNFMHEFEQEYEQLHEEQGKSKYIFQAILITFKKDIYWLIFLGTCTQILNLGNVLFLGFFLKIINDSLDKSEEEQSISRQNSLIYAFSLITNMIINLYCQHHHSMIGGLFAIKLKSAVTGLIYRKTTSMKLTEAQTLNMGKILNVVTSELNAFERNIVVVLLELISPVTFIGTALILYFLVGWTSLVGVLYCLIIVLIQKIIVNLSKNLRRSRTGKVDDRLKEIQECLEEVRIVKLYSLEKLLVQNIKDLRNKEAKILKIVLILEAFSKTLIATSGFVGAFLIFFVNIKYYEDKDEEDQLTLSKIISCTLLMSQLNTTLSQINMGFTFTLEMKLIFNRINSILDHYDDTNERLNSVRQNNQNQMNNSQPETLDSLVIFQNYNGYWEKLTAVIGKNNAGKSCLIKAILNELPDQDGNLYVKGKISYVDENPVVFSGTLRENILLGNDLDAGFYNETLQACGLLQDIETFEKRDMIEIGERGLNISGGQKARIALARAIYHRADIVLLEDILTPLDPKMVKAIFDKAVRGMLKNKTVIMTTYRLNIASQCDHVIVMDQGKIICKTNKQEMASQKVILKKFFMSDKPIQVRQSQKSKKTLLLNTNQDIEKGIRYLKKKMSYTEKNIKDSKNKFSVDKDLKNKQQKQKILENFKNKKTTTQEKFTTDSNTDGKNQQIRDKNGTTTSNSIIYQQQNNSEEMSQSKNTTRNKRETSFSINANIKDQLSVKHNKQQKTSIISNKSDQKQQITQDNIQLAKNLYNKLGLQSDSQKSTPTLNNHFEFDQKSIKKSAQTNFQTSDYLSKDEKSKNDNENNSMSSSFSQKQQFNKIEIKKKKNTSEANSINNSITYQDSQQDTDRIDFTPKIKNSSKRQSQSKQLQILYGNKSGDIIIEESSPSKRKTIQIQNTNNNKKNQEQVEVKAFTPSENNNINNQNNNNFSQNQDILPNQENNQQQNLLNSTNQFNLNLPQLNPNFSFNQNNSNVQQPNNFFQNDQNQNQITQFMQQQMLMMQQMQQQMQMFQQLLIQKDNQIDTLKNQVIQEQKNKNEISGNKSKNSEISSIQNSIKEIEDEKQEIKQKLDQSINSIKEIQNIQNQQASPIQKQLKFAKEIQKIESKSSINENTPKTTLKSALKTNTKQISSSDNNLQKYLKQNKQQSPKYQNQIKSSQLQEDQNNIQENQNQQQQENTKNETNRTSKQFQKRSSVPLDSLQFNFQQSPKKQTSDSSDSQTSEIDINNVEQEDSEYMDQIPNVQHPMEKSMKLMQSKLQVSHKDLSKDSKSQDSSSMNSVEQLDKSVSINESLRNKYKKSQNQNNFQIQINSNQKEEENNLSEQSSPSSDAPSFEVKMKNQQRKNRAKAQTSLQKLNNSNQNQENSDYYKKKRPQSIVLPESLALTNQKNQVRKFQQKQMAESMASFNPNKNTLMSSSSNKQSNKNNQKKEINILEMIEYRRKLAKMKLDLPQTTQQQRPPSPSPLKRDKKDLSPSSSSSSDYISSDDKNNDNNNKKNQNNNTLQTNDQYTINTQYPLLSQNTQQFETVGDNYDLESNRKLINSPQNLINQQNQQIPQIKFEPSANVNYQNQIVNKNFLNPQYNTPQHLQFQFSKQNQKSSQSMISLTELNNSVASPNAKLQSGQIKNFSAISENLTNFQNYPQSLQGNKIQFNVPLKPPQQDEDADSLHEQTEQIQTENIQHDMLSPTLYNNEEERAEKIKEVQRDIISAYVDAEFVIDEDESEDSESEEEETKSMQSFASTQNITRKEKGRYIAQEDVRAAQPTSKVYWSYFQSIGYCTCMSIISIFSMTEVLTVWINSLFPRFATFKFIDSQNLHRHEEEEDPIINDGEFDQLNQQEQNTNVRRILAQRILNHIGDIENDGYSFTMFFIILLIIYIVLNLFKTALTPISMLNASTSMLQQMINSVLQGKIIFFEKNPSGRIMNRFSNDGGIADRLLPFAINEFLQYSFAFLAFLIYVAFNSPLIIIAGSVAFVLLFLLVQYSKKAIQQTRILELIMRNPITSLYSETISSLITLRAYNLEQHFIQLSKKYINQWNKANTGWWVTSRFLSFYGELIAILFSGSSIIILLYDPRLDLEDLGVSVQLLILITSYIQSIFREAIEMNMQMSSPARIFNYINNEEEREIYQSKFDKLLTQEKWPRQGHIIFKNVYMKFRDHMKYQLKNINFQAQPGEKVAFIGRSGAGKSTLFYVLFRIFEIHRSKTINIDSGIFIDGMDITKIGVEKLRNAITIIPQFPLFFSGTVKNNLDPKNQYTDEKIWKTLKMFDIDQIVKKLDKGLNTDAKNMILSIGLRQIFFFVRAYLNKSKILLFDEATGMLDRQTSDKINKITRDYFQHTTILTVAHKLQSITYYDKVIMLEKGEIVEIGHPLKLLAKNPVKDKEITNKEGFFSLMVQQEGEKQAQKLFKVCQQNYLKKYLQNKQQPAYVRQNSMNKSLKRQNSSQKDSITYNTGGSKTYESNKDDTSLNND